MKRTFLIILFIASCLHAFAQTYVSKVYNEQNEPLYMASVLIKHRNRGVTTNGEGKFMLSEVVANDTLLISHVGYGTREITVSQLPEIIKLTKSPIRLKEIAVSSLSAREIVSNAIENLDNYRVEHRLEGFFREELYEDDSLSYVAEAIVQTRFPHNENDKGKVFIKEKQTLYSGESKNNIRLVSGPYSIVGMNEIFVQKAILNKRRFKLHDFEIANYIMHGNKHLLEIHFKPKDIKAENSRHNFTGKIYVEQGTYNIHFLEISNETTKLAINYKEVNNKMLTSNFSLEKLEVLNSGAVRYGKVNYSTTNFQKPKREGKRFFKDEKLASFSNSYDKDFWTNKHTLLQDSILTIKIQNLAQSPLRKNVKETVEALYRPSLSFMVSDQLFNDIDLLSLNLNSQNRLAHYFINKSVRNKSWSSFAQVGYTFFSLAFQGVEAERRILAAKDIRATYNPTSLNGFYRSYCKGVSNAELEALKTNYGSDFLRLHTVRYESNFNTIKKIEEELFKQDFLSSEYVSDFLDIWFIDYFMRRMHLTSAFLFSSIDITYPIKSEEQMPISLNSINSYVKYLHNPNSSFIRDISKEKLSESERAYASQIRWMSGLNLIPAITNLLPPIQLSDVYSLRISGAYLPITFGNQFEQNFYLKSEDNLGILNVRQFVNSSKVGFGLGVKLLDMPLYEKFTTTFQTDYWRQPSTLSFYDDSLSEGFSLKQDIMYRSKKVKYQVGWTFKTAGFIDYATSLEQDFSIRFGTTVNF